MSRHVTLNLLGIGLWTAGFALAWYNIYPYCFIGFYGGPPFLLFGVISWIKQYKRNNGRYPSLITSYRKAKESSNGIFTGLTFLLSHIPEFWTAWFVFFISITLFMTTLIKSSDAYKTSIEYLKSDNTVNERVGQIKYYGLLPSGSISSNGTGNIKFSIIGDRGALQIQATVENIDGQSRVKSIEYN